MPVSATLNTIRPGASSAADTRTSPRSVNFSAFEIRLRRICETLPSSEYDRPQRRRVLEHQRDRLVHQERAQHAAQRAEQVLDLELRRPDDGLAGLYLGEIEQVVHQLRQLFGGLADVDGLGLRLAPRPLAILDHQVRQAEDRVHRRAELVGHVREESRLELVGAPEVIRLLVELGIERHHAAIGVFELAVQVHELLLLSLQVIERAQQGLVLMLDLLDQAGRAAVRAIAVRDLPAPIERDDRMTRRQELLERDRGSLRATSEC